jgi:hypothetical protein
MCAMRAAFKARQEPVRKMYRKSGAMESAAISPAKVGRLVPSLRKGTSHDPARMRHLPGAAFHEAANPDQGRNTDEYVVDS